MKAVTDLNALQTIYGEPVPASLTKVVTRLTPLYRQWINSARLLMLSTVGPEGTDCSPRGEDGPVVRIVDDHTIWLPDWRGNNRIDSLRNIVRDGRVSLMFLVRGSQNVVRLNGRAIVTVDPKATESFEQRGKHPRSVIVFTLEEAYFQCAKAFMRSGLWSGEDDSAAIPTVGEMIKEQKADFDAQDYDATYAEKAQDRMW